MPKEIVILKTQVFRMIRRYLYIMSRNAIFILFIIFLLAVINILLIIKLSTKQEIVALGYIDAKNKIKVYSKINGIVKYIFVKDCQEVKIGDTLVIFDKTAIENELYSLLFKRENLEDEISELLISEKNLFQNSLYESSWGNVSVEQLKYQLDEAYSKYIIAETLYSKHLISKSDYDSRVRDYKIKLATYNVYNQSVVIQHKRYKRLIKQKVRELQVIQNEISTLKSKLAAAVVCSPIDGFCCLKNALDVGKKINEGDELLELFNLENIYFSCHISENEVFKVKRGTKVKIFLNAYPFPQYPWLDGAVDAIDEIVNPDDWGRGWVRMKITVTNVPDCLISKLYLSGKAKISTHSDVPLITKIFGVHSKF
ncbi:MAG: efflux RND transporter periplasmic adaptor subunit [candidate division WOR-3 bacterium]